MPPQLLDLLPAVAIFGCGLQAGIMLSVIIHDWRVGALPASGYAAMHAMRDAGFRRAMPPLMLGSLAVSLLCALVVPGTVLPMGLSALLLLLSMQLTVRRLVPLNRRLVRHGMDMLPADIVRLRGRWERWHRLRTALSIAAFIAALAAGQGGGFR
ncbi:anthrone oxygenase family protein [Sandaracinobacteroides saxicola]|uniref:DUF1772 domain-containing protein n=1 Tax=Sandaracinobacteroides saxicola TaxID=2759707 RepID=A0A7G5IHC2_9SPHN|nr:anthrone oxygenase family protein [Sandaracinobacteroides saxicola]QMW22764.1 DUF1772 domain-containing protein [Sandaracinobacteroides saxicola]